MKHFSAILISLLFCCFIHIHSEVTTLSKSLWQKDARSLSLGGGMNAIDQSDSEGLSVSYFVPYQLFELSSRSIKIAQKTKWMNLDGYFVQTGDEVYMENYLSLGVSRTLSKSFIMGIKAGYFHCSSIIDEKASTWLSELSCKYKPYEKLQIYIYLFNPTGSKIKRGDDFICMNQSFHLGGSFYPVEKIEWLIEVEKVQQESINWHLGIEYAVWDVFCIRAGLSAKPLCPSWGFGGKIRRFKYALGGNAHPVLGLSSCFSLYYIW
jgi:hypothetical protein